MSNGGIQGHFHTFGLYPYFAEVSILYSLSMYAYTNFVPHDVSLQRKSKFFF